MWKLTPLFSLLLLLACHQDRSAPSDFTKVVRFSKTINNMTFNFPSEIGEEAMNAAIKKCQDSITENLALISEAAYTDTIDVEFFLTKAEIGKYTGRAVSGIAVPARHAMYSIIGEGIHPPIQHELMHMITMTNWGHPDRSIEWLNEGIATWAGGTCSDYTLEEIYNYFLQSSELIGLENFAKDFYSYPEMKSYTQCAYLSEYLADNFGIDKVKQLWQTGFYAFEEIYGFSVATFEENIAKALSAKYSDEFDFDWETFKKGC